MKKNSIVAILLLSICLIAIVGRKCFSNNIKREDNTGYKNITITNLSEVVSCSEAVTLHNKVSNYKIILIDTIKDNIIIGKELKRDYCNYIVENEYIIDYRQLSSDKINMLRRGKIVLMDFNNSEIIGNTIYIRNIFDYDTPDITHLIEGKVISVKTDSIIISCSNELTDNKKVEITIFIEENKSKKYMINDAVRIMSNSPLIIYGNNYYLYPENCVA